MVAVVGHPDGGDLFRVAPNDSGKTKIRRRRGSGDGIKGEQVVFAMGEIAAIRGAPKTIRVDNGPELVSKALDRWAYENGVTLDFLRPGKPTDNAFVESFNGKFRAECLDAHWFLSLEDARAEIEAWRRTTTRTGLTRPWAG